ncbi:secretion protein HlyD family protein [Mizugakiibacter sediminis]|uniref:Secretion protein HlyD family protein n=1 Tax=Mizugakiibacter sediminis TaxID=1475481 RepID=A0A0K8QJ39_9GAMM|nr:efflux RND transporter periplasmic adaptor subunit [Mizugakiibacter sediminis]GAP64844.1 secretion protein HlyD family protein [Mizugakiibacter sediminis]
MKRLALLLTTVLLAACGDGRAPPPDYAHIAGDTVHAGGLVEPAGEERVLIPELSGRVAHVYVREGERVQAGQVIAELANADLAAQLAAAEATVAQRRAELEKARRGPRIEDIRAAEAALAEADAQAKLAAAERARREQVYAKRLISREEVDVARADAAAAAARRARAAAQLALLRAGTRSEDITAAEAALKLAEAQRGQAAAVLEKSRIRAPVSGVVLQRELREGETVVALSPLPVARIGDLSQRYVRADIELLDIGRVRVGQRATITSDAYPGRRYAGTVVQLGQRMGERHSVSEDPADKRDVKVLDARIRLDGDPPLPVGLRVDVAIDAR